MRTIGKVNIRKLKAICAEECRVTRQYGEYIGEVTRGRIMARVPEAWTNIWESAWSEIERLVSDELSAHMYGRRTGAA